MEHPDRATGDEARGVDRSSLDQIFASAPENMVDPWWMDQVLRRGLSEFLYRRWAVDLQGSEPEVLDVHLPEGARLVRRGCKLTSRILEAVVETEEGLALLSLVNGSLWVGVAGCDLAAARALLGQMESAFPRAEVASEAEPSVMLGVWSAGEAGRGFRRLEVKPWGNIDGNYAPSTRSELERLMNGFAPSSSGQLLIWHGPPGTGKTFALGALADAWRGWATLHYVADPEALLGDPAYLLEVMMFRESTGPRWKVIILEDAGGLFQVGARRAVGQDLSRLLNVTDGMLGQGARALFVITTNEPIAQFHEAVVRPGRCASRVLFEPLPIEQAKPWLLERGCADVAKRLVKPATIAELFAMASGQIEPEPPSVVGGLYL